MPEPKENEILVRVIASGVNPADPLILNGKFAKEFGTHLPLILGYDMAGVVVKTGAKVTKLKVGDPVYAYLLWGGGWAEYCISNEGESSIKPKSLSFVDASAVPLAATDRLASVDRHRKNSTRPNRSDSRRFGRRRKFCDSNCKSARRASDRYRLNRQPGFAQATRRRRCDRLHKTELGKYGARCRFCAAASRRRNNEAHLWRDEERRHRCDAHFAG